MSNDRINNGIILKVISAYLYAFIAYALGIWLGTLFGNSELQAALPRFIVKDALPAVSAAFFGNIFCLYIFHLLYPIKKRGAKAFLIMVSILTFIAVISGAAAFIAANSVLRDYSITSIIIIILYLSLVRA